MKELFPRYRSFGLTAIRAWLLCKIAGKMWYGSRKIITITEEEFLVNLLKNQTESQFTALKESFGL